MIHLYNSGKIRLIGYLNVDATSTMYKNDGKILYLP
jgi:hypothetical protein